jgi:hypothetical protein
MQMPIYGQGIYFSISPVYDSVIATAKALAWPTPIASDHHLQPPTDICILGPLANNLKPVELEFIAMANCRVTDLLVHRWQ